MITACRVRLRPILMTSLATIIGHGPHGYEARHGRRAIHTDGPRDYRRPRSSVLFTIFIVPAAYSLVYGKKKRNAA